MRGDMLAIMTPDMLQGTPLYAMPHECKATDMPVHMNLRLTRVSPLIRAQSVSTCMQEQLHDAHGAAVPKRTCSRVARDV